MTYDYYEERRKEQEKHIYRNQFGGIIPKYSSSLEYSLGNMDSSSAKQYELDHPINATLSLMEKTKEINILPNSIQRTLILGEDSTSSARLIS